VMAPAVSGMTRTAMALTAGHGVAGWAINGRGMTEDKRGSATEFG